MIVKALAFLVLAITASAEPKRNPYVITSMVRARSQATPRKASRVAVADRTFKVLVEAPARRRDNPYVTRKPRKR